MSSNKLFRWFERIFNGVTPKSTKNLSNNTKTSKQSQMATTDVTTRTTQIITTKSGFSMANGNRITARTVIFHSERPRPSTNETIPKPEIIQPMPPTPPEPTVIPRRHNNTTPTSVVTISDTTIPSTSTTLATPLTSAVNYGLIVGSCIGGVALIFLLLAMAICCYRRSKKRSRKRRNKPTKLSLTNGVATLYRVHSTTSDNVYLVAPDNALRDRTSDLGTANLATSPSPLLVPASHKKNSEGSIQRAKKGSSVEDSVPVSPVSPVSPEFNESVYQYPSSTLKLDRSTGMPVEADCKHYENSYIISDGIVSEEHTAPAKRRDSENQTQALYHTENETEKCKGVSEKKNTEKRLSLSKLKWVNTPPLIHTSQSGESSPYIPMTGNTLDVRKTSSADAISIQDILDASRTLPTGLPTLPPKPCGVPKGKHYVNLKSEEPQAQTETSDNRESSYYEAIFTLPPKTSTPACKVPSSATDSSDQQSLHYTEMNKSIDESDQYYSAIENTTDDNITDSLYMTPKGSSGLKKRNDSKSSLYETPQAPVEQTAIQIQLKMDDSNHKQAEVYENVNALTGKTTHKLTAHPDPSIQRKTNEEALYEGEYEGGYTDIDMRSRASTLYSSPRETSVGPVSAYETIFCTPELQRKKPSLNEIGVKEVPIYEKESLENYMNMCESDNTYNSVDDRNSAYSKYEVASSVFEAQPVPLNTESNLSVVDLNSASPQPKKDTDDSLYKNDPCDPTADDTKNAGTAEYCNVELISRNNIEKASKSKPLIAPKPKASAEKSADSAKSKTVRNPLQEESHTGSSTTQEKSSTFNSLESSSSFLSKSQQSAQNSKTKMPLLPQGLKSKSNSLPHPNMPGRKHSSNAAADETVIRKHSKGNKKDKEVKEVESEEDEKNKEGNSYINVLKAVAEAQANVQQMDGIVRNRGNHSQSPTNSNAPLISKTKKQDVMGSERSFDSGVKLDMTELQKAMKGIRKRNS